MTDNIFVIISAISTIFHVCNLCAFLCASNAKRKRIEQVVSNFRFSLSLSLPLLSINLTSLVIVPPPFHPHTHTLKESENVCAMIPIKVIGFIWNVNVTFYVELEIYSREIKKKWFVVNVENILENTHTHTNRA